MENESCNAFLACMIPFKLAMQNASTRYFSLLQLAISVLAACKSTIFFKATFLSFFNKISGTFRTSFIPSFALSIYSPDLSYPFATA